MLDASDHRAIGARQDLFHLQEEAPGSVFWHPRGWALYRLLEEDIRRRILDDGYEEVRTPQLLDQSIWQQSGHWESFRAGMFALNDDGGCCALKPVNCPGHIQIFKQRVRSYRDMPLRLAEFGSCHRNEPRGALSGLMRLRSFVQDDAHIFCLEEQAADEVQRFCALFRRAYAAFGLEDFSVKFSTRPAVRAGSDALWGHAEHMLAEAARRAGLSFEVQPGEGAFYGPKLEFILKDARGRSWQCGTLQVDLVMPERFGLEVVGLDGGRIRPAMIHRALLGSLERFLGILLEHHNGLLPMWLAPQQVLVATVSQVADYYAGVVGGVLREAGLRVAEDTRAESIARKIADAHQHGIGWVCAVGRREVDAGSVSLRDRHGQQRVLPLAEAVRLLKECAQSQTSSAPAAPR